MKKIFLIGYYGAGNLGDEMLLSSSLKLINETIPQNQISVITHNKEITELTHQGVNTIYRTDFKEIFTNLFQSDLVLFGGGSLLQDMSSFWSLLYYCSLGFLALIFRKKVIFLSHGFGPFKNSFSEWITAIFLRFVNGITIREGKNNRLFARKANLKYQQSADLAWLLEPNELEGNLEQIYKTVTSINEVKSVLVSLRKYPDLNDKSIELLADFLQTNFSQAKFYFLALQPSDLEILDKLCQAFSPDKYEVNEIYDVDTWHKYGEQLFKTVDFAVCTRFHAVLLTIKYFVPSIAISYDHKVEDLAEILNIFCLPAKFIKEDLEMIKNQLERVNLQDKVSHYKDFVDEMTELVEEKSKKMIQNSLTQL